MRDYCPNQDGDSLSDVPNARGTWQILSMETASVTTNQPEALLGADFLTAEQLAQALGFSERTLARLHVRRQGPPRVVLGRTILYKRSSVLAWLAEQEAAPERQRGGRHRRGR